MLDKTKIPDRCPCCGSIKSEYHTVHWDDAFANQGYSCGGCLIIDKKGEEWRWSGDGGCSTKCPNMWEKFEELAKFKDSIVNPTMGLKISMAMRLDHGFGILSRNHQDSLIVVVTQVLEEVQGIGFYHSSKEMQYTSMLNNPQSE